MLCEKMDFSTALVVCPLNTVLNWLNEFEKWQEGLKDEESLEVEICHHYHLLFTRVHLKRIAS